MGRKYNAVHVAQEKPGIWRVRKAGANQAMKRTGTQKEAIDAARAALRKTGGGELVIHGQDGAIRKKDTVPPGKDDYPPKG